MDMDSITASAACAAVTVPSAPSRSATGRTPNSVDGNRAKASFMVTQVEESHLTTNVL